MRVYIHVVIRTTQVLHLMLMKTYGTAQMYSKRNATVCYILYRSHLMFNVSFEVVSSFLIKYSVHWRYVVSCVNTVILFSLQSLESVLAGRHTVINAETGSGKTLCTYREGVIIGTFPVHFVVP